MSIVEAKSLGRRLLLLVAACLIATLSMTLLIYFYRRPREPAETSWLESGMYMVYEQFFVWNGNSKIDYMVWNVTKLWNGFADLSLISHGVNVTEGEVELTIGEANLTIDVVNREVVNGSDAASYYLGEKWPFWTETNVTIGSTIDIWYGTNVISSNESIYVLGKLRDCWVVEYYWMSGSMKRWFDKSSGILLKIYNVLYRQGVTIVVTETAVLTNIDLQMCT